MSQQLTTISLEAIQYMCGLIRDLASVSEAIDNTNLADDKVFSNLYTKKLIDKCLEDANTESQKLVGALTHLTCEETTVQPTLDNSSINVIYLYSATGNAPYQQYLKISDTKLIDLGTTSLSLSGYLTATEIARDYITKLDFDALKTEVKGKVDKTSILTTIDNLATDDQIYSASIVNSELDNKVNKADIIDNLTSTDTNKPLSANQGKILNDTKLNKTDANRLDCVSIDNVSLKEYILTNFTGTDKTYYLIAKTTCTDLPKASNFYITVETPGLYTYKVTAKELNDSNGRYVCTYRTLSSSWTAWEKVCTTKIADVPRTAIVPTDTTKFPSWVDAYYLVSNGICYVSLWGVKTTESGDHIKTDIILPKPLLRGAGAFLTGAGTGTPSGFAYVQTMECILMFDNPIPNELGYCSFSYPVAE